MAFFLEPSPETQELKKKKDIYESSHRSMDGLLSQYINIRYSSQVPKMNLLYEM